MCNFGLEASRCPPDKSAVWTLDQNCWQHPSKKKWGRLKIRELDHQKKQGWPSPYHMYCFFFSWVCTATSCPLHTHPLSIVFSKIVICSPHVIDWPRAYNTNIIGLLSPYAKCPLWPMPLAYAIIKRRPSHPCYAVCHSSDPEYLPPLNGAVVINRCVSLRMIQLNAQSL